MIYNIVCRNSIKWKLPWFQYERSQPFCFQLSIDNTKVLQKKTKLRQKHYFSLIHQFQDLSKMTMIIRLSDYCDSFCHFCNKRFANSNSLRETYSQLKWTLQLLRWLFWETKSLQSFNQKTHRKWKLQVVQVCSGKIPVWSSANLWCDWSNVLVPLTWFIFVHLSRSVGPMLYTSSL